MRRINHKKGLNVFILMASFLLTASKAQSLDFRSTLENISSKTMGFFQNSVEVAHGTRQEIPEEGNTDQKEDKVNSSFGWEITNCL